jgi:hypothetical protein
MTPENRIALKDVLSAVEYERVRERVMALKRARRVAVGRYLSFVFETRDTMLFQVQEMCRVERITDAPGFRTSCTSTMCSCRGPANSPPR